MTLRMIDNAKRPKVLVVGDFEQPEFLDVVSRLREDAKLHSDVDACRTPDLIVIAEIRPGTLGSHYETQLRRRFPLSGIVSLLGSWCEGQARASRPGHSTLRLYWHEFPLWWRRQLALYATGRCPEWAHADRVGFPVPPLRDLQAEGGETRKCRGVIELCTPRWETADALADILRSAGYSTVWRPPGRRSNVVRGTVAGVWEGGQLDDRETTELAAFCRRLADDAARVVALLDFPRKDRCEAAYSAGAAVVLGKPWINADLISAIEMTSNAL